MCVLVSAIILQGFVWMSLGRTNFPVIGGNEIGSVISLLYIVVFRNADYL